MSGAPAVDPALAAIAAAAQPSAKSTAPAVGGSPGEPAAPVDWRQEARDLWRIVAMLHLRFPSLKEVYTDEAIERLAEVWAPILERHQLDLGKLMIYFTAATATLPVLGETYSAVKADREREKQADAAKGAEKKDAPAPNAPPSPAFKDANAPQ